MSTQIYNPESLNREPTNPERNREMTVRFGVFHLENALQHVEAAAIKALKELEQKKIQQHSEPIMPTQEYPQPIASVAVESAANNEADARKAVDEVFKDAN